MSCAWAVQPERSTYDMVIAGEVLHHAVVPRHHWRLSSNDTNGEQTIMRSYIPLTALAIGLLTLAACNGSPAPARTDARAPTDVGNMAYPAPSPAGAVVTTHP